LCDIEQTDRERLETNQPLSVWGEETSKQVQQLTSLFCRACCHNSQF